MQSSQLYFCFRISSSLPDSVKDFEVYGSERAGVCGLVKSTDQTVSRECWHFGESIWVISIIWNRKQIYSPSLPPSSPSQIQGWL